MGRITKLIEATFRGKGTSRVDVPTDSRGRPISRSMTKMIKQAKELEGQSGLKLRTSLDNIVDKLKDFQRAVKDRKAYDLIKNKTRRDFESALLTLSNMVAQIKKKGLRAVESEDKDLEQWEKLEHYCKSTINYLKNL